MRYPYDFILFSINVGSYIDKFWNDKPHFAEINPIGCDILFLYFFQITYINIYIYVAITIISFLKRFDIKVMVPQKMSCKPHWNSSVGRALDWKNELQSVFF